ncbi:MAG: UPF0147 family protein [Candidatus Diapherotrites archaeon]|uniref:UPF0147 family protein n=1 Tax=Candidatus Iainarchaeum sp. TaxID=3101447 RepID=A0A8T4L6G3_9ARCH|nr:UPF0147 family protein [Candidatus Diapherotrites archaeon]
MRLKADVKKDIAEVKTLMEGIVGDSTVPRNIRSVLSDAIHKISSQAESDEIGVAIGTAIYLMEDISSDINMPSHTRTEIWTIISQLESIKEKLK